MGEKENKQSLFGDFTPISSEEWKEKIIQDLKGADYDKKMLWKTPESFVVEPYFMLKDIENLEFKDLLPNEFPYIRGKQSKANNWFVCQNIYVENLAEANTKAKTILTKGVQSLVFVLKNDSLKTKNNFATLLDDIDIANTPIHFILANPADTYLDAFVDFLKEKNIDSKNIQGSVSYDPLNFLNQSASFPRKEEEDFDLIAALIQKHQDSLPKFKFISVNAAFFNHTGLTAVQSLAFAMAMGVEYISKLNDRGIDIDSIAANLQFRFAIGGSYFMEIAKFRAAKYLWAKIMEAYSPVNKDTRKINIHAETSFYKKTTYDAYVNMLRTTTEAMSAIIGGVDSLSVHAFDMHFRKPSDFSERIARNQQLVIKEEAYFDKVVDPAAGSYYIEKLCESLITAAWDLFLRIEDEGGYINAFKKGIIQEEAMRLIQNREMQVAKGREQILGTNQFPNAAEKMQGEIDETYLFFEDYSTNNPPLAEKMPFKRAAEDFEALRIRTEKSGKTPKVFLFNIGNPAMSSARAQFTANFFGCAGFEPIDNKVFSSVEEGIEAAKKAKAEIVVVCSSDDEYAEVVPKIYHALKEESIVVVAGAPTCMDELKEKGIMHFINIKSPLLESLEKYQKAIGIN